jgi:hypothetical protein
MEVAVVAEAEEVEFETFTLHHALIGEIADAYLCKVGLAGDGAEACELRAVELHPVVVLGVFVLERFEHLGSIVLTVLGLATQ